MNTFSTILNSVSVVYFRKYKVTSTTMTLKLVVQPIYVNSGAETVHELV